VQEFFGGSEESTVILIEQIPESEILILVIRVVLKVRDYWYL
jgi:hypothetical protein